jgi:hypothetical protein
VALRKYIWITERPGARRGGPAKFRRRVLPREQLRATRIVKCDMRVFCAAVTCALLVVIAMPATAAPARLGHHPCAVPRGWAVIDHDRQATVIRDRPSAQSGYVISYRFCVRASGKYQFLIRTGTCCAELGGQIQPTGSPNGVFGFALAGHYLGFDALWSSRGSSATALVGLTDLDRQRTYWSDEIIDPYEGIPAPLVSSNGAAVWLMGEASVALQSPDTDVIGVITPAGSSQLDSAPIGTLAELELYRCAAGCSGDTTIITWTHGGSRRYAAITG